jgi:hypothetical protein
MMNDRRTDTPQSYLVLSAPRRIQRVRGTSPPRLFEERTSGPGRVLVSLREKGQHGNWRSTRPSDDQTPARKGGVIQMRREHEQTRPGQSHHVPPETADITGEAYSLIVG